jgi:hypothetical protein
MHVYDDFTLDYTFYYTFSRRYVVPIIFTTILLHSYHNSFTQFILLDVDFIVTDFLWRFKKQLNKLPCEGGVVAASPLLAVP